MFRKTILTLLGLVLLTLGSSQTSRNPANLFLFGKQNNDAKTIRFRGMELQSDLVFSPANKRMRLSTPLVLSPHADDGYYLLFADGSASPPGFFVQGGELRLRQTAGGAVLSFGDLGGGGGSAAPAGQHLVLSDDFLDFSQSVTTIFDSLTAVTTKIGNPPSWGLTLVPEWALLWERDFAAFSDADQYDEFGNQMAPLFFGNSVRNGIVHFSQTLNHEVWHGRRAFFSGNFVTNASTSSTAATYPKIFSLDFLFHAEPSNETPWIALSTATGVEQRGIFAINDSGNGPELTVLQGDQADSSAPVIQVLEVPQKIQNTEVERCRIALRTASTTCTFVLDRDATLPFSFRFGLQYHIPPDDSGGRGTFPIGPIYSPVQNTNNAGALTRPYQFLTTASHDILGSNPLNIITTLSMSYQSTGRLLTVTAATAQRNFYNNSQFSIELSVLRQVSLRRGGNTANVHVPVGKVERGESNRLLVALAPITDHVRRGGVARGTFNPWMAVKGVFNGIPFGPIPLNKRANEFQLQGLAIPAEENYISKVQMFSYDDDVYIDQIPTERLYTRIDDHFGVTPTQIPLGFHMDVGALTLGSNGRRHVLSTYYANPNITLNGYTRPDDGLIMARIGTDSSINMLIGNNPFTSVTFGNYEVANSGQRSFDIRFNTNVWTGVGAFCFFVGNNIQNPPRAVFTSAISSRYIGRITNIPTLGASHFTMVCGGHLQ